MINQKKTAIVLFNLGGPDKISSVKPFLFNLFNDPAIINLPQPFRFFIATLISNLRKKKAQNIYAKIGGKSPLLQFTQSQAYALEKELSFFGNFKVFIAMRYFEPFSDEAIKNIMEYQPQEVILLPLYPQFSTSTTESSLKDFLEKFSITQKRKKTEIKIKEICCYFEDDEFILSHAKLIKKTIENFDKNINELRFLFSAHGLPQKLINEGDPYVFQIEKTSTKIIQKLAEIASINIEEIDYKICYQSKVGPMQWTSPSLEHEIKKIAIDNKIPVIIPISFVSDHSETLVELDIDYKEMAKNLGIANYLRVPALNNDGHFIHALAEICKNVSVSTKTKFSGSGTQRNCDSKLGKCWCKQ